MCNFSNFRSKCVTKEQEHYSSLNKDGNPLQYCCFIIFIPRSRNEDNVFGSVCVSVCRSVCLSVCYHSSGQTHERIFLKIGGPLDMVDRSDM